MLFLTVTILQRENVNGRPDESLAVKQLNVLSAQALDVERVAGGEVPEAFHRLR
jgi:hypothetical protein